MADAVRVDGIKELMTACKVTDRELQLGLQRDLKGIAAIVAVKAKEIAERKGLHDTGKLISAIRPGVQGSSAVVRDSANKHGFNYPAVYEGELSGHGLRPNPKTDSPGGKRPFLGPALDEAEPAVLLALEGLLERMSVTF